MKKQHLVWSSLLALALLATLVVLPTSTAHASKRLTTIPKALQGY